MPLDLDQATRALARQFTDCLNGTITDGIRLTPTEAGGRSVISYRPLGDAGPGIPLTLGKKPRYFLNVWCALFLDDSQRLSVESSRVGLFLDADLNKCLFRYEYELDNDPYPDAHFHVHIEDQLREHLPSEDLFEHLHFPVGAKRYRPCLEDVVEFLIVEEFVEFRPGWRDVVDEGRARYWRTQLDGAIRENIDLAQTIVREIDQSRTRFEFGARQGLPGH